jgi:hypothetical protein
VEQTPSFAVSNGWWVRVAIGMSAARRRQFEEKKMKKTWKKPSLCQVAAGMEISRYLPAEIPPRK